MKKLCPILLGLLAIGVFAVPAMAADGYSRLIGAAGVVRYL